jgi:predicted RNase H-like HicB family nuclease
MKYLYIIEKGKKNFSAYVPDLPGCIAAAKTKTETEKLIKEAIEFHIEGMIMDGEKLPDPISHTTGFFEFKPAVKANHKRSSVRKRKVTV